MRKDFDPYASDPYAFGEAVRELRSELDLSQKELGRRMGVSQREVSKLEVTPHIDIRMSTFVKLCEALGADPLYMLDMWKETGRVKDA